MTTLVRLVTFSILLSLTAASSAAAATYGGSATGVQVTVPATGTTIRAATGSLSISGGGADASLLVGDVPGSATGGVVSFSAGVMHSSIVGLDATSAEASMGAVSLSVSGNQITADFLMARSTASCGPAVTGSSQLTNLVINGQSIVVTGAPNQTVALPNGAAIINEQIPSIEGSSAELIVNALHVTTTDAVTQQELADVLLATVDAKINCQGGSSPTQEATSGGGWIPVTGGKATFGVHGHLSTGPIFSGHLVFIDHAVDRRVQSTSITNFQPGCTSMIDGEGTSGSDAVRFEVTVQDNGEGANATADTFRIDVFDLGTNALLYSTVAQIPLGGGNIQAHKLVCPP